MKIGSMSRRKGNSALEKGYFKRTKWCPTLQSIIVLIEGMRNANGGKDLELEVRGRHRRRDHREREEVSTSVEGCYGTGSHQSRSYRHWDRWWEYTVRDSISSEEQQPRNVTMDTMSRALHRAARSPFSRAIEQAPMLSRFTQPPFNSYDGKTDLVEHVSHYIQMMYLHTHNDALMCKVFPSSLWPTTLRWFNELRKGSIHSFAKLIQEFGVRFMTYSQVP